MSWTLVLGVFASPACAMSVYHRYADMAAFNFPVAADTLRAHLNPALSLDLDRDGQAWVSVVSSTLVKTSIDGLPIPFIKPNEVQIRTYVSGPTPGSNTSIQGVWLFDLFLAESSALLPTLPDILGADLLWSKTIRVVDGGNIKVEAGSTSYNLTAPKLKVTDNSEAALSATASVSELPLGGLAEWFLERDAWFGENKAGELTVSMLHDHKRFSIPRRMGVSAFSSTVFQSLSLGDDFGVEVFTQHEEGCFFIGDVEATFESSVPVKATIASERRSTILV